MARFNTSGLDKNMADMKRMGELAGPTADKMLMAGADQVKQAWKASAEMHGHIDTGDMVGSIGYPHGPKDANGIRAIDIYPQGKDRKGVRNVEKAFILHYGTSKKPGSHWVDTADQISEDQAIPAMAKVWDEHLKGQ